ncbi:hypothetical protein [Pedobacter punctiformis]|uniref:Uncharacterized protein n=1 Tax=Pedobacter punctiformis TaxID=3004097 RepID=A0ABT4LCS1_9SPHI|nr:hypothetical protein [Pedobacter sp. HCMS5-2]MCZ4244953.1 hypothetical protein [Pedobacter sp. HCMS5-2]
MKTVEFGQMKGYPHYLQIKLNKGGGHIVDMVSSNDNVLEVGDVIEKLQSSYTINEIVEERPAKGDHPIPVTFQRLLTS